MAIGINNKCVKMDLPNGKVVDILTPVLNEIEKWLQINDALPESGGYIVGYQHKTTGNISLEDVSHPYELDNRSRIHFDIRDPRHKIFLMKAKNHRSYYMGVWHTHPQIIPTPSDIDWEDWHQTLKIDKTASNYIFFIIAGTNAVRVWIGDSRNGSIVEITESKKKNDLYIRDI